MLTLSPGWAAITSNGVLQNVGARSIEVNDEFEVSVVEDDFYDETLWRGEQTGPVFLSTIKLDPL